jgi:hypothetical protein
MGKVCGELSVDLATYRLYIREKWRFRAEKKVLTRPKYDRLDRTPGFLSAHRYVVVRQPRSPPVSSLWR